MIFTRSLSPKDFILPRSAPNAALISSDTACVRIYAFRPRLPFPRFRSRESRYLGMNYSRAGHPLGDRLRSARILASILEYSSPLHAPKNRSRSPLGVFTKRRTTSENDSE